MRPTLQPEATVVGLDQSPGLGTEPTTHGFVCRLHLVDRRSQAAPVVRSQVRPSRSPSALSAVGFSSNRFIGAGKKSLQVVWYVVSSGAGT